MSILQYVYLYLITIPLFFALDMLWLGVVAKNMYRDALGALLRDPVNWTAAFIFYALFMVGLLYFAIVPALKDGSVMNALISGALFGFFTYATYDLTNLATLKDWPLMISLVDMVWGSVLCGCVAAGSVWIARMYIV